MPSNVALENIQRAYQSREAKNLTEALSLAKGCLEQFPDNPESHCLWAILQLDQRKYLEAEKSFNIAISLYPHKADYYFLLGETLKHQKRFLEAKNAYEQCLKLQASHEHALLNLGGIEAAVGNIKEGMQIYGRIIALNSHSVQAHYRLAILYHKQNHIIEAINHYEQALQDSPNDLNILSNLGAAYTKDRQYEKGIACLTKVLSINPDFIPAITNLGGIYIETNQFSKAEKYLRESVTLNPLLAENWRNLTLCATYKKVGYDARAIQRILKNPTISTNEKIHAYFALGKIYHDCQLYDKAYEYYHEGNGLKAKIVQFKPQYFKRHISRVIKAFDKKMLHQFDNKESTHAKSETAQPLIIVGTSRSGKSILERLLKQVPGITAAGEVGIAELGSHIPQELLPKGNYPFWLKDLSLEQAQGIKQAYDQRLQRDAHEEDKYIMDTIPGNFMYLGLIAMLFPKAKFIFCQRHPLDTCLMMHFKYYVHGHGYTCQWESLAVFYQQFQRMMKHWKSLFKERIIDVKYEEMLQNPRAVIKKIAQDLSLTLPKKLQTTSLSTQEIGVWKHYKKHLKVLANILKQQSLSEPEEEKSQDTENSRLKDLMGSAYQHFEQNQFISAKAECEAILEAQNDNYAAWHLLGRIYQSEENWIKSSTCLEKAILNSPQNAQLHADLATVLRKQDRQMEAEHHEQLAEKIQQEKKLVFKLTDLERAELLSAFSQHIDILDEFECKLLLRGKVSEDQTTGSYLTRSWDRYFDDLSHGSYRLADEGEKHTWRMRTWHFLYKNIAVIDYILNQPKEKIRILDVGCATGYFRRFLEGNLNNKDNKKIYYWGLDIREDVLAVAVKDVEDIESGAKGNRVPSAYIVHDISYGLPYKDNYFDYVINFEMIKYLPIELGKLLLLELHRVLSPRGNLYLSTTLTSLRPGFMENVPFEQFEKILKQSGFVIKQRRGSQTHLQKIIPHLREDHLPLVKSLLAVHPPEMVAAMITPIYPQCAEQVTFYCQK